MVVDVDEHRCGRQHGIQRSWRPPCLGRVEMWNERIAAKGTAGKQEVHVLQMTVEAWSHVDAIEHAEAVAEGSQGPDQPRGKRFHAVAALPDARFFAKVVLDLFGLRHRKRARVE